MIRLATPADVPHLVQLVKDLAEYEREPDQVELTPALLHDAIFGPDAVSSAHVACPDDQPETVVGMAIWFRNFSTWTGRPGIYLEDLFVAPEHRGAGHGRALLIALAAHAVERGYGRMDWSVLDWNAAAIGFYRSLGAGPNEGWTTFRLDGVQLTALAAGA
jgi:GNAT superfamily N-acetyltransferase